MQSRIILLALITVSALVGCDRNKGANTTRMSTEETIRKYRHSPISEYIEPVIKSLARQSVFVGTEGVTPTEGGKIIGKIRLKTGIDNQGRPWVYAYTSRVEFD